MEIYSDNVITKEDLYSKKLQRICTLVLQRLSTIFDRLKLNHESIITKYTLLLNFSNLGYKTRANIMLKVDRDDKESMKEFLSKHQDINSVYKINNGFDFMIEGIFKQINDSEAFIDQLEKRFKLLDHKMFFIAEDIKRDLLCRMRTYIDLLKQKI